MNRKEVSRRQFRFLSFLAVIAMGCGLILEVFGKEGMDIWIVSGLVLAISACFYTEWRIEELKEHIEAEQKEHMRIYKHEEKEQ